MASIIKVDRILDSTELGKVDIPGGIETDVLNATELIADTWKNVDGTENYKCKCWVNFDGSTTPPTIRASGNVSSVVRNATGIFTINLTSALTDSNYVINFCSVDIAGVGYLMPCIYRVTPATTSSFSILTTYQASSTSQQANPSIVTISVFR